MTDEPWRVVRADRGAVLVVPAADLDAAGRGAGARSDGSRDIGGSHTPGGLLTPDSSRTPDGSRTPGGLHTPDGLLTPGGLLTPDSSRTPDGSRSWTGARASRDPDAPHDSCEAADSRNPADPDAPEDSRGPDDSSDTPDDSRGAPGSRSPDDSGDAPGTRAHSTDPTSPASTNPAPTSPDPTDPGPRRVALARDGLAPSDEGRVVPAVGDLVLLDATGIARVLPRRTALVRDTAGRTSLTQVLAANVDVVLVVEHLDPEPDLGRVERLLTLAWRSGARPVVVLTKADLVPEPRYLVDEVAAVALGADVLTVSVPTGRGLDDLRALLASGVVFVLVGPSGAGKSTLVNALAGREVAATGERRADGRGRHTTTWRELVHLDGGAMLVDTPGIRSVGLVADAEALDHAFADVADLARGCRFSDCSHTGEPGCAVLAALESGELPERRFVSWRKLEREAAFQERRVDARLAAAEKARWRRIAQERRRIARG